MPIYEYQCSECNMRFETKRAMSQATEGATCPHCGRNAFRILSRFVRHSGGEVYFAGATEAKGSSCSSCSSGSCSTCGS